MKPLEIAASVFFITVVILSILLGKSCNKQKTVQTIIKDTSTLYMRSENAKFKSGNDKLSGQILLLSDSIEKLKGSLKTTKIIYKEKIVKMWSDTMMTVTECKEYVDAANIVILQQDSIITIQSIQIGEYAFQVENLSNQVKFNEDIATKCSKKEIDCFVTLSKFKHFIFRLYRKQK